MMDIMYDIPSRDDAEVRHHKGNDRFKKPMLVMVKHR